MRLDELAAAVGGTVEGDAALQIVGVAGLEEAGPAQLSFLANRRYAALFRKSAAGAVLVGMSEAAFGRTVVRCRDPYLAFARALALFFPITKPPVGTHALAVVEGCCDGATILPFAYVGPGAVVGAGTIVHPHVYVGPCAVVGRDCLLMAGSVVMDGCVVGDRVVLNPGAVVGGDGFGFVPTAAGLVKIPQTGRVVVGDDVEIGSNSCVDRAAMGDTTIATGSKLDNLVQIGHGAEIGPHNVLVAYSAVAGSTRTGVGVTLAARTLLLGHLDIGDGVVVGAMSMVTDDVPAGGKRTGSPAIEHREWLRLVTAARELPALLKRVAALENKPGGGEVG
ncbi:MAG: UDP-3-O-(3-hydroxymyristoyl)glucosamine N-acyltransferase [Myxococcales bacterium]|nr:UDP-3-O-(3-hydroxymyristoyl)glucosamine N-acyltransferase [Myxococcales bacterium]